MAKLDRSAFLYLHPRPPSDDFAQCSTCRDWVADDARCYIHGPSVKVFGTMSCGLYVNGDPLPAGHYTYVMVTPTESGLVDREVRCENCRWGGPDIYECELFHLLNRIMSDEFDLDTGIEPKGCCNAQQPREETSNG